MVLIFDWTPSKVDSHLISGTPYRSLTSRIIIDVAGMVDSPMAKRGWVAPSTISTFAPLRARHAASIVPDRPDPMIATS